jgi:hypothetical protein
VEFRISISAGWKNQLSFTHIYVLYHSK